MREGLVKFADLEGYKRELEVRGHLRGHPHGHQRGHLWASACVRAGMGCRERVSKSVVGSEERKTDPDGVGGEQPSLRWGPINRLQFSEPMTMTERWLDVIARDAFGAVRTTPDPHWRLRALSPGPAAGNLRLQFSEPQSQTRNHKRSPASASSPCLPKV